MKRILMATLLIALVMAPIGIASGANKQIQFPSWMWGEAGTGDWFKDGVALYESQNPGVKVAPALVPAGQYEEKLLIDMAGGGAPDLAPVFTNMMPKLIDAGYIYIAQPPLFSVSKGKTEKYAYKEEDMKKLLAEMGEKGVSVKRYKGLGEMDADQLADTTMSPRHRTLRRLTVDDAAAAERVFEMLMGNEVAPRKEFIIQGAYAVEADRIDA